MTTALTIYAIVTAVLLVALLGACRAAGQADNKARRRGGRARWIANIKWRLLR